MSSRGPALNRVDAPLILFEANVHNARGFNLPVVAAKSYLQSLALPKFDFFEVLRRRHAPPGGADGVRARQYSGRSRVETGTNHRSRSRAWNRGRPRQPDNAICPRTCRRRAIGNRARRTS